MAKSFPTHVSILAAANYWVDRCLIQDGSVFTEEDLWTPENLEEFKVRFIENYMDDSRSFMVKLRLPNPDGKVKPGFFARATLLSKSAEQLVVPNDAVVSRGPSAHVVAVRDGKAVVVPVKRGATDGEMLAVTGQLTDKDVVVTYLEDGALRSTEPNGQSIVNEHYFGFTKFNSGNRVHTEELVKGKARAIIVELK